MFESLPLFGRTLLIGVAVAAPLGAMGVLCIQRTLASGWGVGMLTGLGIASADGLYAGVAAFGVSALAATLVAWQTPLRLVGGAVLIVLGIRAALQPPTDLSATESVAVGARGAIGQYSSALALTLANPTTIMAFGAIFAGAGLGGQPTPGSALTATLGVALGSLAWWTLLTSVVAITRHQLRPGVLSALNRVSGAVIVAFGLLAIGSVLFG